MLDSLVYKNEFGLHLHELPADRSAWFDFIERRLIEVHEPKTKREWSVIAELAEARRELLGLEQSYQTRLTLEAERAADVFDRQLMDDFFRLERLWRKNVHATHAVFTRNVHAVSAIARNWHALAESLSPDGAGGDVAQAIDAVLAEGLAWKVQEMTPEAWWIMGRWLAGCHNTEESIMLWLKRSGLKKGDAHAELVREKLKSIPDAQKARADLFERAAEQARLWHARLVEMQAKLERERAAQAAMAMGIGEKGQSGEMRSARTILKFNRDRVEKVERHLAALQKERRDLEAKNQNVPGIVMPLVRAKMARDRTLAEAARQKAAGEVEKAAVASEVVNADHPRMPLAKPRPAQADTRSGTLFHNGLCMT
jgi:hypothetical protein